MSTSAASPGGKGEKKKQQHGDVYVHAHTNTYTRVHTHTHTQIWRAASPRKDPLHPHHSPPPSAAAAAAASLLPTTTTTLTVRPAKRPRRDETRHRQRGKRDTDIVQRDTLYYTHCMHALVAQPATNERGLADHSLLRRKEISHVCKAIGSISQSVAHGEIKETHGTDGGHLNYH